MKTHDLIYLLLICLSTVLLSCEKSTDHTANQQLTFRGDEPCDACELLEDCCCGIELIDQVSGVARIRVCGNDDGTTNCTATPPSPCGAISGGVISATLNSTTPKLAFCMEPGEYFRIQNTDLSDPAVIKVTCHYDIVNPTYSFVTITPGGFYVWEAEEDCDLVQCYP